MILTRAACGDVTSRGLGVTSWRFEDIGTTKGWKGTFVASLILDVIDRALCTHCARGLDTRDLRQIRTQLSNRIASNLHRIIAVGCDRRRPSCDAARCRLIATGARPHTTPLGRHARPPADWVSVVGTETGAYIT